MLCYAYTIESISVINSCVVCLSMYLQIADAPQSIVDTTYTQQQPPQCIISVQIYADRPLFGLLPSHPIGYIRTTLVSHSTRMPSIRFTRFPNKEGANSTPQISHSLSPFIKRKSERRRPALEFLCVLYSIVVCVCVFVHMDMTTPPCANGS